MSMQVTI
jgi:hypothetical protein